MPSNTSYIQQSTIDSDCCNVLVVRLWVLVLSIWFTPLSYWVVWRCTGIFVDTSIARMCSISGTDSCRGLKAGLCIRQFLQNCNLMTAPECVHALLSPRRQSFDNDPFKPVLIVDIYLICNILFLSGSANPTRFVVVDCVKKSRLMSDSAM